MIPLLILKGFLSVFLITGGCLAAEEPPPEPNVARLGTFPDWSVLDKFQRTMTGAEFAYLLNHCYARDRDEYEGLIEIQYDRALIVKQSNHVGAGYYTLWFKEAAHLPGEPETYWRDTYEMDDAPEASPRLLEDVKVAIDPGHIGGDWVRWDDRHFAIGMHTIEVREGEMTLRVARLLERDLGALGAIVQLTRYDNNPVTDLRPEGLYDEARAYLMRKRMIPSSKRIKDTTKKMFAISSEIRSRAETLNEAFQPDIALCLHFNASPWGSRPSFRASNHLHLLINGCYSKWEISEDDTRFEMVHRILQRIYYEELALAKDLAKTMAEETRLPPFDYGKGGSGKSVCDSPYIWARNLLANRAFMCPVVFFEPYCMNHREVHARVQAGEYRGLREFDGVYKKNIYQEYADGVTSGLVKYFKNRR